MRPQCLNPQNEARARHEAAIKKLNDDVITIIDKVRALANHNTSMDSSCPECPLCGHQHHSITDLLVILLWVLLI